MNARAELLQPVDAPPERPREAAHPIGLRPAPAADTRARSLAKAVSYRLLATVVMAAIAWAITRRLAVAAAIAGADSLLKTGLFYAHERLWARVRFGRPDRPPR